METPSATEGSVEQNKALYRRYLALHSEPDRLDEVVGASIVSHERPPIPHGIAALKDAVVEMHSAFSDITANIVDLVAEDDRIVARIITKATHTGPLKRFAPTGRRIETERVEIVRIADGKIVERWLIRDRLDVLIQLGQWP
jgi:predicted ester cyclase